jgi:hypothetical protein
MHKIVLKWQCENVSLDRIHCHKCQTWRQVVNFIEVLNPIQHQIFSTFSNESYEEHRNDVENLEESLGSSAVKGQQFCWLAELCWVNAA